MPNKNNFLNTAKKNADDEWYSRREDIEDECQYYDWSEKHVYLPSDNYICSAFWKYFKENFHQLGLKHLTATHYAKHNLFVSEPACRADYDGENIHVTALQSNGDFRSPECRRIMDECDIICTNPPFSLFRMFFDAVKHKKFLVVAPITAFYYEIILPYVVNNEVITGVTRNSGGMLFDRADGSTARATSLWMTNIQHGVEPPPLELTRSYNPEDYPRYTDFDAINVDFVKDIPKDYYGAMGVPITFLYKWNRSQFEMLGTRHGVSPRPVGSIRHLTPEGRVKEVFGRLLIKRVQSDSHNAK